MANSFPFFFKQMISKGVHAAEFIKKNLCKTLEKLPDLNDNEAIVNAVLDMDKEFCSNEKHRDNGSTIVFVLATVIQNNNNENSNNNNNNGNDKNENNNDNDNNNNNDNCINNYKNNHGSGFMSDIDSNNDTTETMEQRAELTQHNFIQTTPNNHTNNNSNLYFYDSSINDNSQNNDDNKQSLDDDHMLSQQFCTQKKT